MKLRTVALIRDAGVRELIRDLLADDEVLALWPPDEGVLQNSPRPIHLLVVDLDDLSERDPFVRLIEGWARTRPTIMLSSRVVVPRRQGPCLTVPKPIPLHAFFSFVNALRPAAPRAPGRSEAVDDADDIIIA